MTHPSFEGQRSSWKEKADEWSRWRTIIINTRAYVYGTRHAIVRSVQMVAQTGLISLARFARARTVGLPTDRYDRNFDLTSIYRDRSYERVGRHSCFLKVRIIVSEARRSRSLYQWPSVFEFLVHGFALSLFNLFPAWSSKSLGGIVTTDEVTGSSRYEHWTTPGRSVVSRLGEGHANLRSSLSPSLSLSLSLLFFFSPLLFLLLLLLRFLLLCEIRSQRRSAAFKLRAGNGSRRPEAKCVWGLSDRDNDGAVALFLSRAVYHCSHSSLTKMYLQLISVVDRNYLMRRKNKWFFDKYI